jgi:gamma-glutamylputrescine oxidase
MIGVEEHKHKSHSDGTKRLEESGRTRLTLLHLRRSTKARDVSRARCAMKDASLWLDEPGFEGLEVSQARGRIEADVAIIGAGITGLSTACHLKARFPDLVVVVLERDRVGSGASGRSSGALTDIPERRWAYKLARDGEEETRRAAAFQRSGVETVLGLIREGDIDCDLASPGYLMLGLERHVPHLQREAEAMQRFGRQGRFLTRDEVRTFVRQDFYQAGVYAPAYWLNPGRYVRSLARLALRRGARIFEQAAVREVRPGHPTQLRLSGGGEVRAGTVVLATNGYTSRLGLFRGRVFPVHTCAVATEPLSPAQLDSLGWEGRQVIFEAAQTGHTLFLTPDDRLVCRGTIHYHFNDGVEPPDLTRVEARLTEAIHQRFPQLGPVRISHRWSGVLGMTRWFYPAIGRLTRKSDTLYGIGYSGHGIAYATLAGRLVTEMYAGDTSTELAYAQEHATPPLMPPEPFRYLGFYGLTRWWQKRGR